jgi:hypothetical protein
MSSGTLEKPKPKEQVIATQKPSKRLLSSAILAIGLFMTINMGISLFSNKKITGGDQSAVAEASQTAIDQYQSLSQAPDIALIGSSLMMAPVWSLDNKKFPQTADIYHHHRSLTLEQNLAKVTGHKQAVFSFGLPGLMVSDAFLLNRKLLSKSKHPQTIVIGVAPRDFMDDLLTGETRTAIFQQLMTLDDLPEIGDLYLNSWTEKADFILNNSFYLYGKRFRYQDKLSQIYKRALRTLHLETEQTAQASGAGNDFLQGQNRALIWSKSIEEYKARYKHFNEKQFSKQSLFLVELVKAATANNIKVVLVNMPLTQDNLAAMPKELYPRFSNYVQDTANRYGCKLINMQANNTFSDNEFYDTVHLNAKGGEHFLKILTQELTSSAPN